jgi:nucleotide sugar dehydrogenase
VLPQPGNAGIYVISVDTPVDVEREFVRTHFDAAFATLATRLRPGDLVIVRSTVPIGTTRALAEGFATGGISEVDVACCPDRSVGGDVFGEIHRLPQIVGGASERARARAMRLFVELGVEIVPVNSVEAAEAVKLVGNVQRDVVFALANEVAMMCDAVGLDANDIIRSSNLGYVRSALAFPGPVGGPCLTKDTFLYSASLRDHGARPHVALIAREVNARVPVHAATFITRHLALHARSLEPAVIAILGIAYKGSPETGVVAGGTAASLRDALAAQLPTAEFRSWDPIVAKEDMTKLGFIPCGSAVQAAAGATVLVLANDHPQISALPIDSLACSLRRPALIYDFWSWKRSEVWKLPAGVVYRAFGSHVGPMPGHEPT